MPTRNNVTAVNQYIYMRVTTSQYEISDKNQLKRFPTEHNLPAREKQFIGTRSILAKKSRVMPTYPLFTLKSAKIKTFTRPIIK